jgi:hypothetical protein
MQFWRVSRPWDVKTPSGILWVTVPFRKSLEVRMHIRPDYLHQIKHFNGFWQHWGAWKQYNSLWILKQRNKRLTPLGVFRLKIVALIRYTSFEIVRYLCSVFCCDLIRHYEDAAISIEFFCAVFKKLNLGDCNAWQPFPDFIPPCVLEWCRRDNQQWPIVFVNVRYSYRLNSFTDAHLVPDQNPPKHTDTGLNSLLLKFV